MGSSERTTIGAPARAWEKNSCGRSSVARYKAGNRRRATRPRNHRVTRQRPGGVTAACRTWLFGDAEAPREGDGAAGEGRDADRAEGGTDASADGGAAEWGGNGDGFGAAVVGEGDAGTTGSG